MDANSALLAKKSLADWDEGAPPAQLPEPGKALSLRSKVERRWAQLISERDGKGWLSHWRELSDYILPRKGQFLISDHNRGTKFNQNIFDSTGLIAHRTCAAGLMAGLTSPARPWFRLISPDPDLNAIASVKTWLSEVDRRMLQVMQQSNFYNSLHALYEELALFGTGAMVVLEDYQDIIHCETFTAGEYALGQSNRRVVDTLYRQVPMTVLQIVQDFGFDNVSEMVKAAYGNNNLDQTVTVVHAIEPNLGRDPSKTDAANYPYRSLYWEMNAAGSTGAILLSDSYGGEGRFLRISGYQESPLVCPRWDVIANATYGRSPGMDSLGDCKQLHVQQKRKGQAIEKMVNPPMQAPSQLYDRYVNTLPGQVTLVADTQGGGVKPLYEVRPDVSALIEDIMATQGRVRSAFFSDLFLMFAGDSRNQPPTAFEVQMRQEEKLLALGPVLERLQSEMLGPAIDRIFAVMLRAGALPEPPRELAGVNLQVDYISVLAQAQKGVATASLERIAQVIGSLSGVYPQALDKLDVDEYIDQYADMVGVPANIVRSDDVVKAIREGRAAQEQQQQQAEMMAKAAPAAKDGAQAAQLLSQTTLGAGRTALDQILGGVIGPGPGPAGPGGVTP